MKLAITGPTSGIGAITFKKLCHEFSEVFLLARNKSKAEKLIQELPSEQQKKVTFVYLDLADLDSVSKAADTIAQKTNSLDVLVNNAGGIFKKQENTKDDFELTFSANHLGHFLLTKKLLPKLLSSGKGKIINVSSEAHRMAKVDFDDLNYKEKSYSSFTAYANAKLFNILFTKSLVDKYASQGLQAFALHPGVVKTNFASDSDSMFKWIWKLASPFMITAEEGAQTSIYLAKRNMEKTENGKYFKKSKATKSSKTANSERMRNRLWEESEKMIKPWL